MSVSAISNLEGNHTGSVPSYVMRAPFEVWAVLFRNKALIWQLLRREVMSRYRGSLLGFAWAVAQPIAMLAAYTFVFHSVFLGKWNPAGESSTEFALMLFAGLILCAAAIDCVNRAPSLILHHANFVKKVVFPLEVLPWVSVGVAVFHLSVSLTVLLAFQALSQHSLNWTVILFPLLVVPMSLYVLGASWFLASVGVFVRDVGHVIGVVTNLMMFLAPVFYPLSLVPEPYRQAMYLNPLTFAVEQSRNLLIMGRMPSLSGFMAYCLCSVIVSSLGLLWFVRTRKGFADVL